MKITLAMLLLIGFALSAAAQAPDDVTKGHIAHEAVEVNSQDLATISKLIDEFNVELTVIGARLDTVEAAIKKLKQMLSEHEAKLKEQESKAKSNTDTVPSSKRSGSNVIFNDGFVAEWITT